MLRNRQSFFQESSNNSTYFQGYPNMMYQYHSQGNMQNLNMPNQMNNFDDYDSRIAKLERQINRLDARITKLENSNKIESIDMSSNMYMV